jgi:hypothetical protein
MSVRRADCTLLPATCPQYGVGLGPLQVLTGEAARPLLDPAGVNDLPEILSNVRARRP